jgi:HD-like signal output (HDOD) protein
MALSKKGLETVKKLKERLRAAGDFPSLVTSVQSVVDLAKNLDTKQAALADQVLGDYSLTKKVMTLANSSMYSAFGGEITNVNQALRLLGTDAVSHIAMGLRVLNAFESAADSDGTNGQLELASASMSGGVARQVAQQCNMRDSEEVAVYTLLSQTGRLLTSLYLPEDWALIQNDCDPILENEQAESILGLSLDELGQAMCEQWNLPKAVISFSTETDNPRQAQLRMVASAASQISIAMVADRKELVTSLSADLGDKLGLAPTALAGIAKALFAEDERLSQVVNKVNNIEETPAQILAKAIDGLDAIVDVQTYMRKSAEAMQKAFKLDRIVTFLRNGDKLKSKLGIGEGHASLLDLEIMEGRQPNLFFASLNKNMPVFIRDAADPLISAALPTWVLGRKKPAKAFILIPVQTHSKGIMLLYGEWSRPTKEGLFGPEAQEALGVLRGKISQRLVDGPQTTRQPLALTQ